MKTAVVAWGRMNPPTVGHEKLFNRVLSLSKRYDGRPMVYASQTQNKKKNPLSYEEKIYYLHAGLQRDLALFVYKDRSVRTVIDLMQKLDEQQFDNVIFVAGSDRVPEYSKFLHKYNGVEYSFDTLEVISAGERDADADGVEGMSASVMRKAAAEGDIEQFTQGALSNMDEYTIRQMYQDVREGLGLTQSVNEDEKGDSLEDRREYYVKKLKQNEADFKDRYGDEWKSVMYATATKMAKDDLGLNEYAMTAVRVRQLLEGMTKDPTHTSYKNQNRKQVKGTKSKGPSGAKTQKVTDKNNIVFNPDDETDGVPQKSQQ